VAVLDIGSNTIKMTVARPRGDGTIEEFAWNAETVRLGAGLETSGRLADDRIEAAMAALGRFAAEAHAHGATRLIAVATEATRVAANGPAFLDRVRGETGIEVRTISGDEEARLTFLGLAAAIDISGQIVVADIGGGSTEVIIARDGGVTFFRSLPLGSGRLTDRLVPSNPPTAGQLDACTDQATNQLAELKLPPTDDARLVVVGGTGEYLGRLLPDGAPLTQAGIVQVLDRLQRDTAETIAAETGIPIARARVLPAGVAIVRALVGVFAPLEIVATQSGIRRGLLLEAFANASEGNGGRLSHGAG
jgi:exopolyphosphatase/guanosine-5'-triphosphate,3'-diphosphate pyrophosphatase